MAVRSTRVATILGGILLGVALIVLAPVGLQQQASISQVPVLNEPDYLPGPEYLPRRFVMALGYWEKTTMATKNLLSLSQFATDWKARVSLPVFCESKFCGIPSLQTTNFREMVNVTRFQQVYRELNLTPFVEFDYFITSASRNLYYIAIDYELGNKGDPRVINCSSELMFAEAIRDLNEHANRTNSFAFSAAQSVCCDMKSSNPVLPEDIAVGCGFDSKDEFTLLFSQWRRHVTQIMPWKNETSRIYAPEYVKGVTTLLPLIDTITDNSVAFLRDLTGGDDFVTVHFRIEKMTKVARNFYVTQCIIDGVRLATEIVASHDDVDRIVYFGDYHVAKFEALLRQLNVEVARFDPAMYHTNITDEAYVAQVEQGAAARAKHLVLVGGGSFQHTISMRFKSDKENVHKVCYNTEGSPDKVF